MTARFSQENTVSSGKNSKSLKDPYRICGGSGTETSKTFTRANCTQRLNIPYSLHQTKSMVVLETAAFDLVDASVIGTCLLL